MQSARLPLAALGALGAFALAACADAPTSVAPTNAPLHTAAAAPAMSGNYLVRFTQVDSAALAARVTALGGRVKLSHAGAGIAVVDGLSGTAAAQLAQTAGVAEVLADTVVSLARPVAVAPRFAASTLTDAATGQASPSAAALFSYQWNLRLIGAPDAWAAGQLGDPGVTVAIIDTGIDYDAPDLNGLVDLSRSASFVPSDDSLTAANFPGRSMVSDLNGHGTNVATVVSSKARAWAGVTSRTTLMGVKVLGADGNGSFGSIMSGIVWAADHGADVANMSLGGSFARAGNGRYVATINQVMAYAGRRGMAVVVAAGNDGADMRASNGQFYSYCSATHVLCVSAVGPAHPTDDYNTPAFYTNYGRGLIDVAAPGGNLDLSLNYAPLAWPWGAEPGSFIWSFCSKTQLMVNPDGTASPTYCADGNQFTGFIGTSQATPHVAGLAALLTAKYGHNRPALIKTAIKQSAVQYGQPGMADPYYGAGRISVTRALGGFQLAGAP